MSDLLSIYVSEVVILTITCQFQKVLITIPSTCRNPGSFSISGTWFRIYAGILTLLTAPRPQISPVHWFSFLRLLIPIQPCHFIHVLSCPHSFPSLFWSPLPALSSLPLLFSLSLLSWLGQVCWSCLVKYILSLFWSLLDASGCTLPHIYNKILPSPQPYLGAIMSSFS